MKHIQGTKITGYVTILVSGPQPEKFFQILINRGIPAWDIKKVSNIECQGKIGLKYVSQLKFARRKTKYKITFIDQKGFPTYMHRLKKRKEIIFSFFICLLLILFLSNIVWDIKTTGVTKDVEEKINKELDTLGIHRGSFVFSMESSNSIQQKLLNNVPDLLWIGVHKKGTTLFLKGVEKEIVEKKEMKVPSNLVASKNGVIESMYISSGQAKVKVNDYVKRGDLLVSGVMETNNNEEDEDSKKELIAAEGEIRANTWYEVHVDIPLTKRVERLTGDYKTKRSIRFRDVEVPYWGLGTPDFQHIFEEAEENHVYFLKWKLPFSLKDTTYHEKEVEELKRTKEEAVEVGIIQAKNKLQLELGPEVQFLSEKVLHEAVENGKVKLKLYISVLENIAEEQEIKQADN